METQIENLKTSRKTEVDKHNDNICNKDAESYETSALKANDDVFISFMNDTIIAALNEFMTQLNNISCPSNYDKTIDSLQNLKTSISSGFDEISGFSEDVLEASKKVFLEYQDEFSTNDKAWHLNAINSNADLTNAESNIAAMNNYNSKADTAAKAGIVLGPAIGAFTVSAYKAKALDAKLKAIKNIKEAETRIANLTAQNNTMEEILNKGLKEA